MSQRWWIDVRDKPNVLWSFLGHFVGSAAVSFEGDLKNLALDTFPGATSMPTGALRRQSIDPILDFSVLPISEQSIRFLKRSFDRSGIFDNSGALIHTQIAQDQLVFGAYDNFHRECVFALPPTPESLLVELKERGFVRNFWPDGSLSH
jgi:hypothetical protein